MATKTAKKSAKKTVTTKGLKKTAAKKRGGSSPAASKKKTAAAGSKSGGNLKTGDRVSWDSSGGTAHGKIVRVATAPGKIKDFEYKASKDDPRYIVETDEGARAAHKASELRKR